jgi:thiol-disulfide isomerase/thioredoxin
MLGAVSVSAAELSTTTKAKTIPTKSTGAVGDQALDLKLAVEIGDVKSDAKQSKAGDARSGKVQQTSANVETSNGSSAKPKALKPLRRKILVFKATWCGACQALNHEWPSMRQVGWRIGSKLTDHIQFVDSDLRPDLVSKYRITALPTLVLIDDGQELSRRGSLGARNIAEFYYGRLIVAENPQTALIEKPLRDNSRAAFPMRKPLLINGFSRATRCISLVESEVEQG